MNTGLTSPELRKPLLTAKVRPYIGMPSKEFAQFDLTTLSARIPYYVISSELDGVESIYVLVFGVDAKLFDKAAIEYPLTEWLYPHESNTKIEQLSTIGIVEFRKGKSYAIQYMMGVSPKKLVTFTTKLMDESGYLQGAPAAPEK